jgi:integrase
MNQEKSFMFTRNSYQAGSLTLEKRRRGSDVWVFRWRETSASGSRVKRKLQVGTKAQYPTRARAQLAVDKLDLDINEQTTVLNPQLLTVGDLVAHYKTQELNAQPQRMAVNTIRVYTINLDTHIVPFWGEVRVADVKTVAVEGWLRTLSLADGTKAKLRNIFSAVFSHGIRHELAQSNPITGPSRGSGVRQSAKRRRDPDVLTAEEIGALLGQVPQWHRALVLLVASIGLRISELRGLKWSDLDVLGGTLNLSRGIVNREMTKLKTAASRKPVPLAPEIVRELLQHKEQTPYNRPDDWMFASVKAKGAISVWPKSLMEDHVRPAAERAGITKHITWHVFRHSYATMMKANGEDVKTVQQSLRHASSKISMDVYTQAIPAAVRAANDKIAETITAAAQPEPMHASI